MLKKFRFVLVIILFLISCNVNTDKDKIIEEQKKKIEELEQKIPAQPVYVTEPHDTQEVKKIIKPQAHFPEGMFETYPQIIKYMFAIGSTIEEVTNILGEPDYKETNKHPYKKGMRTTYYYGKMNIEFNNGVVEDVYNYENNKHYIYTYGFEVFELLSSEIQIEKQWAQHLINNQIAADYPSGL